MKYLILLLALSFALSNRIVNKETVELLKKVAPFEVYEVEENPFRDWTVEEIHQIISTKSKKNPKAERVHRNPRKIKNEGFDFRKEYPECVREVKNQFNCGGDWAFAATTTIEQRFCFSFGITPHLSAQDPLSCDTSNKGCDGGELFEAFMYLGQTGCVEEECWPFTSQDGTVEECKTSCPTGREWVKYRAPTYAMIFEVSDFMHDLPEYGPITSTLNVYSDFLNYKSGIYEYSWGELEGILSVNIVGYDYEDGKDYWIVQNSWGAEWGESGYFRIKFNECGINEGGYGPYPELV